MDAIILTAILRTILTVTTVWNNVETGDIYIADYVSCCQLYFAMSYEQCCDYAKLHFCAKNMALGLKE